MLTLHGVIKPVALSVNRNGDAYVGHATIKQTDFGIKPISVGGGVIKVKNEAGQIDFQIVQRQSE
jgi:polyisoprenoid-binding protein YceI